MKAITLVIFFIAYCGIVARRDKSLYFVYGAAILFLLLKTIAFPDIPSFLNFNVLGIFLGTSILSFLFISSQVPSFLVEKIVQKGHNAGIIYLFICILTSIISAFVENVATILIMAPIALEFTKKYKLNPVGLFIGMAVSSNLQGCGTMIGDSPSIILAMESGMNFNDFFYMPAAKIGLSSGRPGIFFFVQVAAVLSFIVLYFLFRKEKASCHFTGKEIPVKSWIPTILLIAMIVSLAITSFLQETFSFFPAVICLGYGIGGLFWLYLSKKEKISVKEVDWQSFFLLIGIFILVGTLKKIGFIDDIAHFLMEKGGNNPFLLYSMILWMSVFISSFVDNIPYTMAMISGITVLSSSLHLNPYIYLFALLLGATVGGNITPVGASANVVAVGILRKNGYKVTFLQFLRIGLPFTMVAIFGSAYLMWWIYSK